MKTFGYALVGAGYFGAELGRILARQQGAKLTAVLDPENALAVAGELGCAVETDLDALCARADVDAVIVATPNYLHKEPVLAAARHKKHVFCEKPIALCYRDCDAMVKATQESGVVFMAGHVMNFFRAVRHAKRLIAQGEIGEVLYCHSARNGWEEPQPSVSWKKLRAKSGGHLYHHIHELDCIQFILGPAQQVTMTGGNVAHKGPQFGDEDDLLLISMEFSGGKYAFMEYGSAFHWPEHYLLIQGTRGAIRIDMCTVGMTVKKPTAARSIIWSTKRPSRTRSAPGSTTAPRWTGPSNTAAPAKRLPCGCRASWKKKCVFSTAFFTVSPSPASFFP